MEDANLHEIFDRACASPNGLRLRCVNKAAATSIRHRMYKLRKKLKEESQKLYDPTDPSWDSTPYDSMVLTIHPTEAEKPEGEWFVKVSATNEHIGVLKIEEI